MAYSEKIFAEGFKAMAGLVGDPGTEPPPDAGKFSNICKKFLKKIAKCSIFANFGKNQLFLKFVIVFDKNSIEKLNFI